MDPVFEIFVSSLENKFQELITSVSIVLRTPQ